MNLVRTFVHDSMAQVEIYAREILSAISEGDTLRTYLTVLKRLMKYVPLNSVVTKRAVADALIEKERYAL